MSQRVITDCDRCGMEGIRAVKVTIPTDRDDIGDQCYACFELCEVCAGFAFIEVVNGMNHDERMRLVSNLKTKRVRH